MENKIKQLRKGVFELVILQVLKKDKYYGYSLIKAITDNCNFDINEGTIYPILSRLAKEELISSQWVESSKGPPRKYYMITHHGDEILDGLGKEFKDLTDLVAKTKNMKKKGLENLSPKKKKYIQPRGLKMENKYPENVDKIVSDYLTRVRSHMKGVPEIDRDDFLKEIDSHIYESYSEEKNGDEIGKILKVLKKVGEPSEVFSKSAPKTMYKIGKEKNIPLYILIGALIAIFGLPLGFGGLGLILGVLGVLLGIVVAYYAVAAGFTLGGLAGILISIIYLVDPGFIANLSGDADVIRIGFLEISNPTLEGVLGIFISFVLTALGIFLLFMSKYIFRGLKTIFQLSTKKLKEILKRNKRKSD